jgi:hypothetical protein
MSGRRGIIPLALATVLGLFLAGQARAAGFLEKNFWLSGPRYDRWLPPCDYPAALQRISARFAEKESRYWNSSLTIEDFKRVRETAYLPWAHDTIPRRYCRAVALVSDGRPRRIYYSIGEDTGFIGFSWGVEWCVDGLDRNLAYNPHCKMARP